MCFRFRRFVPSPFMVSYIYIYIKQNDFALDERSLGSATTFVFGLCVLQIRLVVFSLIYALRKFVFGFGLLV